MIINTKTKKKYNENCTFLMTRTEDYGLEKAFLK